TRPAAASTATGSATCISSCTAAATSNGPAGGCSAVPTAKLPSGTSAAAAATAAGSGSTPVTRAPRSPAARAHRPAPQRRSSTLATTSSSGARFGYLLLCVIVSANRMAMLVQSLSAKLGLATGRSLPQNCRDRYRRPVVLGLWAQAELVAMATDLAEVMGGAI